MHGKEGDTIIVFHGVVREIAKGFAKTLENPKKITSRIVVPEKGFRSESERRIRIRDGSLVIPCILQWRRLCLRAPDKSEP